MSGALLGRDTESRFRDAAKEEKRGTPSKLKIFGRNLLLSLIALFSVVSVGAGATSKAAIWDLGDQIVAGIMNICNPNAVPYVTDTKSWVDSALGSTTRNVSAGNNKNGNIWSTYNPLVRADGSEYIPGEGLNANIGDPITPGTSTAAWILLLRSAEGSGDDREFLYNDNWSDRSRLDETDIAWRGEFAGDGDRNMYPVNPNSANAPYYNAPTVALQGAYSDAPPWVIHPTYTRYGFESLNWTVYGSSCYSPERYMTVIPSFLFWALVQIPTLITFGLLRVTLGGELAGIFYMFIYPLVSVIGNFLTPWVALIAIVIGLPFIWLKAKGSIQKMLGGALWISAMLTALFYLTNHARQITEFSQGLVVKVSGTMACTIANQAFTSGATSIYLGADEVKNYQRTPVYNADGSIQVDGNGNTVYTTVAIAEATVRNAAQAGAADGGAVSLSLADLSLADLEGVSGKSVTACGSYLDGIYNAFWIGVPLQVWAEGQVGGAQAARDRVAQSHGRIGWYQATLNAMYVNPDDRVGKAQVQAISRWNDGGYTAQITDEYFNIGKPAQWTLDGHTDEVWAYPVTELDTARNATIWKTIPFMLNVKFLCKDDQTGTVEKSGLNGADNAGDYDNNKWLYDGVCITGGDSGVIDGLRGYNFMERVGLSVIGGVLAGIIFIFTSIICVYIGYQKFIWGFMLVFAPIFLGIAAFPNHGQQQFFRKYVEFMIANVIKQIMAVMILVITVTALGRIVFPNAGSIADQQFYVPWMIKPFVALMFMLAAILFALPMKKIMVGAVKGDASVVGKTAESIGDGIKTTAKTTAGLAAAAAVIAGTGGAGTGVALKGLGRAAQGVALRKGGMTGALASIAGQGLTNKGNQIDSARNAKAMAAGLMDAEGNALGKDGKPIGGKLGAFKRDMMLNKAKKNAKKTDTKTLSQRMALAANAAALKKGETAPYAVDKFGNLTAAAKQQAHQDYLSAQKGAFHRSPEFTAISRNKKLNDQRLAAAKASLLPQFTDKDGNVDERGLNAAAAAQVDAETKNMLGRQETIGKDLLAADLEKDAKDRKYLDAKGRLTPAGQKKLLSDIQAVDGNQVGIANRALAHQLMSANPEHYNKFITADNPNGNYTAALHDANLKNFGAGGLIGATPVSKSDKAGILGLDGSQAYMRTGAPVVGKDLTAAEAAMGVQQLGGDLKNLSPEAQKALSNYSEVLQNPDSTPEQVKKAHAAALTALHGEKGLTDASKIVNDQIISPVNDRGLNLSPSVIRGVADELPESSAAMKQTLENYAQAVDAHGADSAQAKHALMDVQKAAGHEDKGVYANAVQAMPIPAAALTGAPGFPAATTPLSPSATAQAVPSDRGLAAANAATRVDPAAESANYVEQMRSHYGLEANPDLKDGQVFTEQERKDIESGKIAPVAASPTALAEGMNLQSAKNAGEARNALAGTTDPRSMRNAARAELGLAPDDAPLTAPLMTASEQASVRDNQALHAAAVASGLAEEGDNKITKLDPAAASANYVKEMRDYYGLKGNNALASGAAFTEREMNDIESGKTLPAAAVSAQAAQQAVPKTPEAVRNAKRAELGLAPDNAPITAPLMTASEQAAVNQMQGLGVQLGDGSPLAPAAGQAAQAAGLPAAAVAGTTAATGGKLVDGAVALTPQAENALSAAIDQRGDGSKYVNGMVVNPQSDAGELSKAVSTLPENHAAKGAMDNYNQALAQRAENPEAVVNARNEVLGALGVATPATMGVDKAPEVQSAMANYTQTLANPNATPEQIRSAESAVYGAAMTASASPALAGATATVPTPATPVVAALTPAGAQRLDSMMEQAAQAGATPEQIQTMKNDYAAGGMAALESSAKNAGVADNVVNDWKTAPPQVTAVAAAAPALTPAGEQRLTAMMEQARESGASTEQVNAIQSGYAQGGMAGLERSARDAGIPENVVESWKADAPQVAAVSINPIAPAAPTADAGTVTNALTPAGGQRLDSMMEQAAQAGASTEQVAALKNDYAAGGMSALEASAKSAGVPENVVNDWKAAPPEVTSVVAATPSLTPAGEQRMNTMMEQARESGATNEQVAAIQTGYAQGGMAGLEASAKSAGVPEQVINEWKSDAPQTAAVSLSPVVSVDAPAAPVAAAPAVMSALTPSGEQRFAQMMEQAQGAGMEPAKAEALKSDYVAGGMDALERSAKAAGVSDSVISEWRSAEAPAMSLTAAAPVPESSATVAAPVVAPVLTAAGEARMEQYAEQARAAGVEPAKVETLKSEYLAGGMTGLEQSARNAGVPENIVNEWKSAEAPAVTLAPAAPVVSDPAPAASASAVAAPMPILTPAGEQRIAHMAAQAREAGADTQQVEAFKNDYLAGGMAGLEQSARNAGVPENVVNEWKTAEAPAVTLSAVPEVAAPSLSSAGEQRIEAMAAQARDAGADPAKVETFKSDYVAGGMAGLEQSARSAGVPETIVNEWKQAEAPALETAPAPAPTAVAAPILTPAGEQRIAHMAAQARDAGVDPQQVDNFKSDYLAGGMAGLEQSARNAGVPEQVVNEWKQSEAPTVTLSAPSVPAPSLSSAGEQRADARAEQGSAPAPTPTPTVVPVLSPSGEQRIAHMAAQAREAGVDPQQVNTFKDDFAQGGMAGLEQSARNAGVPEPMINEWKAEPPTVEFRKPEAAPSLQSAMPVYTSEGTQRMDSMMEQAREQGVDPQRVETFKNDYISGGMAGLEQSARSAGVSDDTINEWRSAPPTVEMQRFEAPQPVMAPAPQPTFTPEGDARMNQIIDQARAAGVPEPQAEAMRYEYANTGIQGLEATARAVGVPENVVNEWRHEPPQVMMPAPAMAPAPAPAPTPEPRDLSPTGAQRMDEILRQASDSGVPNTKVEQFADSYRNEGISGLESAARSAGVPEATVRDWVQNPPEMAPAAPVAPVSGTLGGDMYGVPEPRYDERQYRQPEQPAAPSAPADEYRRDDAATLAPSIREERRSEDPPVYDSGSSEQRTAPLGGSVRDEAGSRDYRDDTDRYRDSGSSASVTDRGRDEYREPERRDDRAPEYREPERRDDSASDYRAPERHGDDYREPERRTSDGGTFAVPPAPTPGRREPEAPRNDRYDEPTLDDVSRDNVDHTIPGYSEPEPRHERVDMSVPDDRELGRSSEARLAPERSHLSDYQDSGSRGDDRRAREPERRDDDRRYDDGGSRYTEPRRAEESRSDYYEAPRPEYNERDRERLTLEDQYGDRMLRLDRIEREMNDYASMPQRDDAAERRYQELRNESDRYSRERDDFAHRIQETSGSTPDYDQIEREYIQRRMEAEERVARENYEGWSNASKNAERYPEGSPERSEWMAARDEYSSRRDRQEGIMESMRARLDAMGDRGERDIEEEIPEEAVEVNEAAVSKDENFDDPAKYQRESNDSKQATKREIAAEHTSLLREIAKADGKIRQLEGLIKKRIREANRLPVGSSKRIKTEAQIEGARHSLDRMVNNRNGMAERANTLRDRLGYGE